MTDLSQDTPPLAEPGEHHFKIAERALVFLKAVAAGNGIDPAQVRFQRHDTAVYSLQGAVTATIKPQLEKTVKKGNLPQGEVMGSAEQALTRLDAFAAETATKPEAQEQIARALEKDPGFGWEMPPQKIPLNAARLDTCVVEKCQKCGGQGVFPCSHCNATGRSVCQTCLGQGAAACLFCHGTGQYTRGDGQQVACTRCQAQGRTVCTQCNGQKTLHCKMCNGTGRESCSECKGSGWWTTIYSGACIAEASFAFDRQAADPAVLALAEGIGLRALAVDGHAEIVSSPPALDGGKLTLPLFALFPVAEAEFGIGGKTLPAQVTGLNSVVTRMDPFLDPYLKPAQAALAKVAEGGVGTGALLASACKSRLVRDVLSALPGQGMRKTYQHATREYGLAVSDKCVRAVVRHGASALRALGRGPRLQGLALGTVLAASVAALWFLTPAREQALALLQARQAARHILACDIAAWLLGWGAAVAAIKMLATRAVARVLPEGEKHPVQAAGDEGLIALFTSFAVWLALAFCAPIPPGWLEALLKKIGM